MLITTWNVNSLNIRLNQVLEYLSTHKIDILCLQETKMTNDKFPTTAFQEIGYNCIYDGEKTYNGVAVISKEKLILNSSSLTGSSSESKRFLDVTLVNNKYKNLNVLNVYIPNGSEIGSDKYNYKMEWLEKLLNYLKKSLTKNENTILLGDFNIAPEDIDVYDPIKTTGTIMTSNDERAMFQEILNLGLIDIFRKSHKLKQEFSWWDYRNFSFKRNHGYRIDLILGSKNIFDNHASIYIDPEPRKNDRPSDHTPVTLELA